ncbi:MAG: hypothetical protein JW809_08975 [Pirellulales bacterium]|nr:hypothetical protein [Pirellulales bacterium]
MTLKPYDPRRLDQFTLRLLDLAAHMRQIAHLCREYQIDSFALHDKKANEWCDNLDRWVRKARAELEMKVIEVRATQRALALARSEKGPEDEASETV